MSEPIVLEQSLSLLEEISEKEKQISEMESSLRLLKFEVQELKKVHSDSVVINWTDSIRWCLAVDMTNPFYFLKTPSFVSKCVAKKNSIELTGDIKNKIATTLSFMYNKGVIGRYELNGKNFYGISDFFEKDESDEKERYTILKEAYNQYLKDLNVYQ